jgi:hypothetical protein
MLLGVGNVAPMGKSKGKTINQKYFNQIDKVI